MIGFFSVFPLIWETCKDEWNRRGPTKNFLFDFINEMKEYITLERKDLGHILMFAVILTFLRQQATSNILKPLSERFNFTVKDKAIFPESCFKFILTSIFYSVECVLLFSTYSSLLTDPMAPWKGWYPGMDVASDIYWMYVTEAGFYIHGIYGIFFMDLWRDDSIMMVLHHVLTISLIVFSLGLRYHKIGLVVLFLHDIADVFLEFTKIIKCFQNRDKSIKSVYSHFVNLGFVCFATSWIVCRIIVYPITVLYSTGHAGRQLYPDAPFYFFFNGLLWILYGMNFYWSCYIVLLLYRVATNKSRGVEDPRELSIHEEETAITVKKEDINDDTNTTRRRKRVTNGLKSTDHNSLHNGKAVITTKTNWNHNVIEENVDKTVLYDLAAKDNIFH